MDLRFPKEEPTLAEVQALDAVLGNASAEALTSLPSSAHNSWLRYMLYKTASAGSVLVVSASCAAGSMFRRPRPMA